MKRFFLLPVILLTASVTMGQIRWADNNASSFFLKEVPVGEHAGKSFRFEMAVYSPDSDPFEGIEICMAEYENQVLVKKLSETEIRHEQDWVIFTITGKVPFLSDKVCIITTIRTEGEYFFDDVNFYIEEEMLRWKQVPVLNPSFEEGSFGVPGYIVSTPGSMHGFELSRDVFKIGQQSLRIEIQKPDQRRLTKSR